MKHPDIIIPPEIIGGIEYRIIDNEDDWLAARRYHHDAYLRAPRIPMDPSPSGMIEDPYVENSDYLGAFRVSDSSSGKEGEISAVLRLIPCNDTGLPAIKKYQLYPSYDSYVTELDPSRLLELSAFASTGLEISRGIFRLAWRISVVRGDTHWFASLHQRTFEFFYKYFHFDFKQIGDQGDYMGETAPYILDLAFQERFFREEFPELHEFYTSENPRRMIDILGFVS